MKELIINGALQFIKKSFKELMSIIDFLRFKSAYTDTWVTAVCLITNISVNPNEDEMQITDILSEFFQILHIDHFGPLIEMAKDSFKHILVVIMFSYDLFGLF